ncbi:MAG: hypothetical protein N2C14_10140, partial [Planctomycetales bacterium]
RSGRADQHWPIGWTPKKKRSEAMPVLMEFLNVEIEPTPLIEVVGILKQHLKTPILIDFNAVVKHEIDLQKKVSFPSKRTYYDRILRTLLSQAKLVREIRVDEADKPFVWITSFKK